MGQNGREDDVRIRRKRPSSLPCHESIVQRSAQKLSIHYGADLETIYNCSSHTSVNQLSLHGAVAEMCEEYESDHDGTGRPIVGGQSSSSFVRSVIKTNVPLNNDYPLHIKNFYCKDAENELNSYHNKTEGANFVRMQDSWLLLKSDSTSGQRTLKSSHILQNHCPVVSYLAKRRRHIWTEGLEQRDHQNWARIESYNLLPTR